MRRIYFDYAATAPIDPQIKKEMEPFLGCSPAGGFGNPSSLHFFGQEALRAVDGARQKIADSIGAKFSEIIFTGSATEANNLALRGAIKNFKKENPKTIPKIIISSIEHESILETARDLEKENVNVVYLKVDKNGLVDLAQLKNELNEDTILVSIIYANNETGIIQPISEISKIINDLKKQSANRQPQTANFPLFHTDAVQAFQFLNCDVNFLGIDLMTLSAHKIYGPKGIGLLYAKKPRPKYSILNPVITGGGQEFGLRSGTENIPAIVGLAKAIELADKNRKSEAKKIQELADYFWKELKRFFPKAEKNCQANHLPNILNVYFPGISSEDFLIKLDSAGVAISTGSACLTRAAKQSYVLKACGFEEERIKSSVRFSFGKYTTKAEIKEAIRRASRLATLLSITV